MAPAYHLDPEIATAQDLPEPARRKSQLSGARSIARRSGGVTRGRTPRPADRAETAITLEACPACPWKGFYFNLHTALLDWQFGPFPLLILAACVAAGIWYLRADWALATRGRKWKAQRTISFFAGLITVDLALQSPVATLTGSYFEAHVIQHLLLMMIAPALLSMGAPMTLILQTSSRRTKTRWLRLFHSQGFAVLSHPLVVWVLYYGVMLAFFLTPLIGFAMNHMWLMDIINLSFLFGATLFWWPMIGLDPIPRWGASYPIRMVNLLIGVPLESFLAIALLSSRQTIAPMYSLASTHAGAGVLWVLSELLTVAAVIPIYFQWMASEDRKTAREDARLDAEAARSMPSELHDDNAARQGPAPRVERLSAQRVLITDNASPCPDRPLPPFLPKGRIAAAGPKCHL